MNGKQPIYRRLKFNVVTYGDDPEEFIEPVNFEPFEDVTGGTGPIAPSSGMGRVVGLKTMTGRLSPFHSFDDYDAANVGCDPVQP